MREYKIKDLPKDFNLVGCKLGNQIIHSCWSKGFWVKDNEKSSQIHPIFFKSFEKIKNWKIKTPNGRIFEIKNKLN